MAERRPTNPRPLRQRPEQDESDPVEERGILELFDRRGPARDEDAPLARDEGELDE